MQSKSLKIYNSLTGGPCNPGGPIKPVSPWRKQKSHMRSHAQGIKNEYKSLWCCCVWLSGQMQHWNKLWRLCSHFNNLFPSYFSSHHFAYVNPQFPLKHKLLAVIGVECSTNMQRNLPISEKKLINSSRLQAKSNNKHNSLSLCTWLTQLINCIQIRYFLFLYVISVRANTIWTETRLE